MNILSIDLDYWFCCLYKTTNGPLADSAYDFILKAKNSIKKSFVTSDHDDFLKYIPETIDHITNIDFHSDLIDPNDLKGLNDIDEGNWINFLKFRSFDWRYPNYNACIKSGKGLCGGFDLEKHWINSFSQVQCIEGIKDIEFSKFDILGISVSPIWLKGLYGYSVQDDRLTAIFNLINYKT